MFSLFLYVLDTPETAQKVQKSCLRAQSITAALSNAPHTDFFIRNHQFCFESFSGRIFFLQFIGF